MKIGSRDLPFFDRREEGRKEEGRKKRKIEKNTFDRKSEGCRMSARVDTSAALFLASTIFYLSVIRYKNNKKDGEGHSKGVHSRGSRKRKGNPNPEAIAQHKPSRKIKKKFQLHSNHPESISSYPQPSSCLQQPRYRYLPYDSINTVVLGYATGGHSCQLPVGALVYTSLGGGKKKGNKGGKLFEKARVIIDEGFEGDIEGSRR